MAAFLPLLQFFHEPLGDYCWFETRHELNINIYDFINNNNDDTLSVNGLLEHASLFLRDTKGRTHR